ncbi:MAG: prepilin peptidase [Peptococcia bacterium]
MILFFVFLFGLVIGSFLNVLIGRLPEGESIVNPPSHCEACDTTLKAQDLIPLISWFLLRGKCRYCGEKIHYRYPLTEFVNGIAWVLIIWQFGLTYQGLAGLFLFSLFLAIALIDLEHYIIPNGLVLALLVGGVIYHFLGQDLTIIQRLIGLAVGFAVPVVIALISRGGMGGGDIKLMATMGFWLGFGGILITLFIAALIGSIIGIALIISGRKKRKDPIPFGPFLVIGFLLIFLYGEQLLYLYWSIF